MYTRLKKRYKRLDKFLVLAFIAGLIPASFIIHIIPVDFSGYYFQAISFLKYHGYSYQVLTNYCDNPINTGVNARAPVIPLFMALSIALFGRNLLGIYFPFFMARILLFPLSYLIAKNYLPKKLAIISTLLLLFIPKLQTYSFSSFEADVFIALFYLCAFYFYLKSNRLKNIKYMILSSIFLGLGALSKSTGFSVAIGFILAIFLENINLLKGKGFIKGFYLFILLFISMVGPYLIWTMAAHHQIYLSTHKDKSIFYIFKNLPSLILTIPVYLGINFLPGLKAKLVAALLLTIFIIGLIKAIFKKQFILIFPTLITLILISTLSTCLIGGNIVGSYEFITILGFTMIPSSIILFLGIETLINLVSRNLFNKQISQLLTIGFTVLLIFKYINNYFAAPYTLEFISGEYYISLPTILKNKEEIDDVRFKFENGLRMFNGPIVHRVIREQFTNFRFRPFSNFYKYLVVGYTFFAMIIIFLTKEHKEKNGKAKQ